jgi:hypothetical protein
MIDLSTRQPENEQPAPMMEERISPPAMNVGDKGGGR